MPGGRYWKVARALPDGGSAVYRVRPWRNVRRGAVVVEEEPCG